MSRCTRTGGKRCTRTGERRCAAALRRVGRPAGPAALRRSGLRPRRRTRFAPFRRCAQTATTSQFRKRAARAGPKPCAPRRPSGAPQHTTSRVADQFAGIGPEHATSALAACGRRSSLNPSALSGFTIATSCHLSGPKISQHLDDHSDTPHGGMTRHRHLSSAKAPRIFHAGILRPQHDRSDMPKTSKLNHREVSALGAQLVRVRTKSRAFSCLHKTMHNARRLSLDYQLTKRLLQQALASLHGPSPLVKP